MTDFDRRFPEDPEAISHEEADRIASSRIEPLVRSGMFLYHEVEEIIKTELSGYVRKSRDHTRNHIAGKGALSFWAKCRQRGVLLNLPYMDPGVWVADHRTRSLGRLIKIHSYLTREPGGRSSNIVYQHGTEVATEVAKDEDDWYYVKTYFRRHHHGWKGLPESVRHYVCDGIGAAADLFGRLCEVDVDLARKATEDWLGWANW